MQSLWPFPWKWSVWQDPDQERTNQNTRIYLKTILPHNDQRYYTTKRLIRYIHSITDPSVLIGVRGKEQDCVPLPTYFCSKCLLLRYVLKHRWKFWGKRDHHSLQHILLHRFRNYKCPEPFLQLTPRHTSFCAIFDWGITWLLWREIYGDSTFFGSGPGFVNRMQSDPRRSGPGFTNPIRSDPVLVLLTPL